MEVVANGILDLLVSQNRTRVVERLFYLQKILIYAEFTPSLIGQGVCIQSRGVSE